MKLGEFRKFNRCLKCDIVIVNRQHKKCTRCYEEEKSKNNNNDNRMDKYFMSQSNQQEIKMKNLGHVDPAKQQGIVRLFYANPNGFGPDNEEKIQTLLKNQSRIEFDGIFLSSSDRSWNSRRVDNMKQKLNNIGRSIKINASNTKKKSDSPNGCMPGGTMSIVWNQLSDLVLHSDSNDKLGRWSSITVGRESKLIEIITFYRVINSTAEGPMKVYSQCNEVLGESNNAKYHREQLLKDLSNHINESKEEKGIKEFTLLGDINEHAESKVILNFMISNGLINMHQRINEIEPGTMDNAFKHGSKCIDVAFCTYGVFNYVVGCQQTECDEIIMNDHRGYLIDIDLEGFCNMTLNKYDKPNKRILDNARKSHVEIFNDKVNKLMRTHKLKEQLAEIKNMSNEQTYNEIDNIFTKILSNARSAVEGPTRTIPYSKRKLMISNEHLHWKLKVKQFKRKQINTERMQRRCELAEINESANTLEEAQEYLKKAEKKWEDLKANADKHREEEMLDYHKGIIDGENTSEIIENRKKAARNVKKKMKRNRSLRHLTRHLGKKKSVLTKLIIAETNQTRTSYDREEIETLLIRNNRKHLSKAMETEACKNRIT